MITRAYKMNAAHQYVYCVSGIPVQEPLATVALSVDREDGTIQGHGCIESVKIQHKATLEALYKNGLRYWANNLVLVHGAFPLEELNKCLEHPGYGRVFFAKIQSGEIAGNVNVYKIDDLDVELSAV